MKYGRSAGVLLLLSVVVCCAVLTVVAGSAGRAAGDAPWGFSLSNMDKTCKPCDDFYQFAMGGWMKANPIPAEYPTWGTFTELRDKNLAGMRTILESASNSKAAAGSNEQKIGDFYASCMDTTAIEGAGLKPLAAELAEVEAIQDRKGLDSEIARLHRRSNNVAFGFGSVPDFKNSSQMIAAARQGGLGMPDRDYYLREDDHSKQLREGYVKHVAKMFELTGDAPDKAASEAKTVMALETSLAKASRTRVELRDPEKNYNKMTLAELKSLTPDWSWTGYMQAVGSPSAAEINIGQPDFFKELDRQLSGTPLADWKVYLRWHVIHNAAPALSDAFVQENFEFYGKQLSGTKELQPRWKRCAQSVNQNLGEALGEVYVQKYFPPEAKARAKEMVNNLIAALRSDIPTLSWMGPDTKKQALDKLQAFNVKIGYPDKWRDYSKLSIDRGSYLANVRRSDEFEENRDLAKIGKPVDRSEWGMTPPTVNAYYNATFNEIVFPAGILQPPFYDPKADDAVNYGGMGAVIGHEISHGFDDRGSQFDGQGNLRNWWTADDRKNFDERGQCIVDQFNSYEVEPGLHQNGKLVLGESIGDLGGLSIAYAAYEKSIEGKRPKDIDGFTPEQRFFLGWAQVWGTNQREEAARLQTNTDPHPLARFRGNGPISNLEVFAKAFGCKKGDAMVREKACKIW
ncbi:MAG TPA: M13 family metallopeptidase [Candidatus Sulfotelmatobacter sp.]|jgi:putative endopeptidase|nr:M13 family metallopeptidase [Candidatus Sulfotelmatobacter sp.]